MHAYIDTYVYVYVTLSCLRSRELKSIHKSCIPLSRDTTNGIHSDVLPENTTH